MLTNGNQQIRLLIFVDIGEVRRNRRDAPIVIALNRIASSPSPLKRLQQYLFPSPFAVFEFLAGRQFRFGVGSQLLRVNRPDFFSSFSIYASDRIGLQQNNTIGFPFSPLPKFGDSLDRAIGEQTQVGQLSVECGITPRLYEQVLRLADTILGPRLQLIAPGSYRHPLLHGDCKGRSFISVGVNQAAHNRTLLRFN